VVAWGLGDDAIATWMEAGSLTKIVAGELMAGSMTISPI